MAQVPITANHCPGAVMYRVDCAGLGSLSRLHTGDFRFDSRWHAPPGCPYLSDIQEVYLDTECANPESPPFPTKEESCRLLCSLIKQHGKGKTIYLCPRFYGYEDLLLAVSKEFGERVFVDVDAAGASNRTEGFQGMLRNLICNIPELRDAVTGDPLHKTRFHAGIYPPKGILADSALKIYFFPPYFLKEDEAGCPPPEHRIWAEEDLQGLDCEANIELHYSLHSS